MALGLLMLVLSHAPRPVWSSRCGALCRRQPLFVQQISGNPNLIEVSKPTRWPPGQSGNPAGKPL